MNKVPLIVAALCVTCLSATSNAVEIKKGTFEISGATELSYSSTETKAIEGGISDSVDEDTATLSLTAVNYVTDNFGLGITWESESTETDSTETSTALIGPAAVINISINNKMSFKLFGSFVLAAFEFSDSFLGDAEGDGYGFTLGGGLSYFINDHVSLNGLLEYGFIDVDIDNTDANLEISGVNIGIGLSVYF